MGSGALLGAVAAVVALVAEAVGRDVDALPPPPGRTGPRRTTLVPLTLADLGVALAPAALAGPVAYVLGRILLG
jgi:hypothetical protein